MVAVGDGLAVTSHTDTGHLIERFDADGKLIADAEMNLGILALCSLGDDLIAVVSRQDDENFPEINAGFIRGSASPTLRARR